ncbi:MAG: alpha/beta hydrolase [Planctomycetota bacterium]|nr:MAG: alpha/beta hydrolase [Planctomycetota bacterium]
MNRLIIYSVLTCLSITLSSSHRHADIPAEQLLWPDGIRDNPITYELQNTVRSEDYTHPDAPLGTCRVYSNVSTPTYFIYRPSPQKNTGVAMVVLPGGGYTDIWLDTEGHDIGLFFKERGITSLVVKYRTNSPGKDGKERMSKEEYLPAAIADSAEAIRILRSRAKQLKIDPDKIGVGGFSAGGHLALSLCLSPDEKNKQSRPNFAFLIYPWIEPHFEKQVSTAENLPPMFIVNGQQDTVTPPDVCAQFYHTLCKNNVPAELHIYRKGGHGFTLGLGKGHSTVQWTGSFIAWLKDINMLKDK